MAKKVKTTDEDVYTYHIVVSAVHPPTKWKAGEWKQNKEALGGFEFTGEAVADLLGYQLAVIAYCNDEQIGICDFIPQYAQHMGHKVFESGQEAWEYLDKYNRANNWKLNVGDIFTSPIAKYKSGEIVEWVQ